MSKGSYASWGDLDSRVCCVCGERIVLRKRPSAQHVIYVNGVARAWSHHCECAPHVSFAQYQEMDSASR